MNTNRFTRVMRAEHAIEDARRRRQLKGELNTIFNGAAMTFAGWLLAVLYCLLSHHIAI